MVFGKWRRVVLFSRPLVPDFCAAVVCVWGSGGMGSIAARFVGNFEPSAHSSGLTPGPGAGVDVGVPPGVAGPAETRERGCVW